jgi:hypothetical protein
VGAGGWRAGLPWGIAGIAVGALFVVLLQRGGSDAPEPQRIPLGGPRTTDISTMTPQERANRLFDRVMRHAEANQTDSVQFFLPMALQAHQMLPALDTDARFHLGLLHLAGGNAAAALAQADTIRRAARTHLFGLILRARALDARRDAAGARRAYGDFLRHEAAERAKQLPEYADHATTLDLFRAEAQKATPSRDEAGLTDP